MVTLFLTTVVGWYLVIIGAFLLSRRDVLQKGANDMTSQHGLLLVLAFITVIIGLLMVVGHNIWVLDWPIVVTLISWLFLIIGLIRLFFPEKAMKMRQGFVRNPKRMVIAGIVYLIIGLFLLFMVYFG